MSIYLLTRLDNIGYDEIEGQVVRAKNIKEARGIANKYVGDEGKIWVNPKFVKCRKINPDAVSCVILEAFNAG